MSVAIPQFHRSGFFKSLFWPKTSVTIPQTQSVRPWYGHWRPSLKYLLKKHPVWQTVVWPLTSWSKTTLKRKWKKHGLWDRGVNIDGPGQKPDRKKIPSLSDSGMASGGLKLFLMRCVFLAASRPLKWIYFPIFVHIIVLFLQHRSQWHHEDMSTGFPCLFTSEWAHFSFYTVSHKMLGTPSNFSYFTL